MNDSDPPTTEASTSFAMVICAWQLRVVPERTQHDVLPVEPQAASAQSLLH
jgi:hypothetical protein